MLVAPPTLPEAPIGWSLFAPLYAESDGHAGFVSFEVSPRLAHDTPGTVTEATRLWAAIARPNAEVQPATLPGVNPPAKALAPPPFAPSPPEKVRR